MEEKQKFGVIDRIVGDVVVIIAGRESQTISRSDLPLDIKEGDSIDLLTYEISSTEGRKRKSRVRELLRKVFR